MQLIIRDLIYRSPLNHNEEGNIISVLRLILRKDVFVFNTQATYNTQRKDKSE